MGQISYPLLGISRLRMATDGEGVTTLIAGAGCPLACRYCINQDILQKAGRLVTAEELYDEVKVDDLYFQATCGGVTFGGGESLLHAAFIRRFREICGNTWRIYAETSLAVSRDQVREAAKAVDAFIVDIKTTDPELYRNYTGRDLCGQVLENLQFLLAVKGSENIKVRVPLIPGYHSAEHQQISAARVRELGAAQIECFRYYTPDEIKKLKGSTGS